ncbi:MAG: DnaA regulatory inactivator Hda [Proteobacteria bacterium]|nr:DnaA regulatory inactivator Hda [Pseudomonadota bacterium]
MRQIPLGLKLPDRAVFGTYLSARNVEAVTHLQEVARGAVRALTWIAGPPGSGKTHLLQATCAAARAPAQAGYLPLHELAPLGPEVLEGVAQLELLCIDDLERIAGHPDWERALFGVVREMGESGGALVMAARSPPSLLPWQLPDLSSRCAAGHVLALRALDEAEQRQALMLRARVRGFELPEETLQWLLRRFPRDMGSLYGLLDTLDEAALAAQRRLTIPFIREVLGRTGQPSGGGG